MRTGNAFFSLTFRESGKHECRLTLLDAGADAVAELVIPADPWEESANVPDEAMSRFRTAVESVPERWPASPRSGEALVVDAAFDIAGQKSAFSGHYAHRSDVPPDVRRFLAALSAAALAALVGARSRKAVTALAAWSAET